jgi:hypothetical protein
MSTNIKIQIDEIADTYVSNSGKIYYRYDNGSFLNSSLVHINDTIYNATLPPANCIDKPEFYFTFESTLSGTISMPSDAPTSNYTCLVGEFTNIFTDNFSSDNGWIVENSGGLTAGAWERGIPVGGGDRGDPPTDYDGSDYCYLTENAYGDSDVDNGYTWLISPTFDLQSVLDAKISYALWYTNNYGSDPNNDLFKTYISDDNGTTWILAETIGPGSTSGWNEHFFMIGDYVSLTDQIRVRFEASDLGSGSVVEAGIDLFSVSIFNCTACGVILSYNPSFYDFNIIDLNETASSSFNIWNQGTGLLEYSLTELCSWLSVTPLNGNSSGEQDEINITINTTGLSQGPYTCNISIISNGGNGVFIVDMIVYAGNYTDISLFLGWNLISVPVDNGWYASDLLSNVTGCSYVVKWDSANQSFWIYIPGFPAFDFPLVPGHGYFVEMSNTGTLILFGNPVTDLNVSLKEGVNLIGWYHKQNTTASSILENISNCSSIIKWDPLVQDYWLYLPGYPAFDFVVTQGMGLFVEVDQDSYWHGEG